MLKFLSRKKPTLDELLRGIKTEEGRATAIINAVQSGATKEARFVRRAVETLEQKGMFCDAANIAENHEMLDRAITDYKKAELPLWAAEVAYSIGRKTDAAKFFLEGRDFERAAFVAFEAGDKKLAITAYEEIADRISIRAWNGDYKDNQTDNERSRAFLEAARFARGARDRRANNLYTRAIQNKSYQLGRILNTGTIFGTTPGKKIKVDELVAIAREFGDEDKAIEIAGDSGSHELGGRLALQMGMVKEAERLFAMALAQYREGTFGNKWATTRISAIHPNSVILHYERTGQYDRAARLARKTGNKEQAKHYSQLAAKLA